MATFVLVPGAWMGGWSWKYLTPLLRAAGHDVYTPTLTGLGERAHLASPDVDLDLHLRDVINVIEYEGLTDVLLLGHSYAGFVVTGVADRVPDRIRNLIYLDTGVASGGKSVFETVGDEFRQMVEEAARASGDGSGWPIPPAETLGSFISVDGISDADLRWFYAKATAHPVGTLRQPLELQHQGTPPFGRTMISCTSGRSGPTPWAEHARTSPDWGYAEIATGHWPMFSTPERLAEILNEVAEGSPARATPR
jgi:pimeloyl-ACP methyl ester carboxylesterase